MDGIVIVDKPQDWTSQDVTARLRRVFQTRRIGHGGTLDPMATGVLPVFVGRATRGVEFFEHAEKTYETVLRLGLTTDTEDITGAILSRSTVLPPRGAVLSAAAYFIGEIEQIPPMYSAIKIILRIIMTFIKSSKLCAIFTSISFFFLLTLAFFLA